MNTYFIELLEQHSQIKEIMKDEILLNKINSLSVLLEPWNDEYVKKFYQNNFNNKKLDKNILNTYIRNVKRINKKHHSQHQSDSTEKMEEDDRNTSENLNVSSDEVLKEIHELQEQVVEYRNYIDKMNGFINQIHQQTNQMLQNNNLNSSQEYIALKQLNNSNDLKEIKESIQHIQFELKDIKKTIHSKQITNENIQNRTISKCWSELHDENKKRRTQLLMKKETNQEETEETSLYINYSGNNNHKTEDIFYVHDRKSTGEMVIEKNMIQEPKETERTMEMDDHNVNDDTTIWVDPQENFNMNSNNEEKGKYIVISSESNSVIEPKKVEENEIKKQLEPVIRNFDTLAKACNESEKIIQQKQEYQQNQNKPVEHANPLLMIKIQKGKEEKQNFHPNSSSNHRKRTELKDVRKRIMEEDPENLYPQKKAIEIVEEKTE